MQIHAEYNDTIIKTSEHFFKKYTSKSTLFRYISLRVYHGILPCPILSAYEISSHNCHRNVSLPSGASLWNGMFGRVEGQYTTIDLLMKWEMIKKCHKYRTDDKTLFTMRGRKTNYCLILFLGNQIKIFLFYINIV